MSGIDSTLLNEKCDKDTIYQVLERMSSKKQHSSNEILPIIKNVVPIYPSLPRELKMVLRRLCGNNYIFISLVIEYAKELGKNRETSIFYGFLTDVLKYESDCLFNYLEHSSRRDLPFIKSILFGSRCYNALSSSISIVEYLKFMKMQWEFVFKETKQYDKTHLEMFVSCLQLNIPYGVDIFIEGLATTSEFSWNALIMMLSKGTSVQQRRFFMYHLVPFLEKVTNPDNSSTIFTLLSQLPFDIPTSIDCFKWGNPYFKIVYLHGMSEAKRAQLFRELLPCFELMDLYTDDSLAEILVMILDAMSKDSRDELSHDAISLNFVTKRLHSEDHLVRERTMFVAKKLTNDQLQYESDFTIDLPRIELIKLSKLEFPIKEGLQNLPKGNSTKNELVQQFNTITLQDSDDESDEEDSRDILFLKDLLLEFEKVIKNDGSELRLLKETVKLVRQKKNFPTEVSFYSKELLKKIATISNKFDEKSFEEWKANALVSILVVCPDKIVDLYAILFNNELSLQQRMVILTSAALSARELRGFDDEFVVKPKYDFPTNRLPWDESATEQQPENNKIQDITEITGCKVTWRSKRLETDSKITQQQNNFRKYATLFFYPLAHAWLNGINLGAFDKVFKRHYISMLKIILTCASPHYELEEMQILMQEILSDAVKQQVQTS